MIARDHLTSLLHILGPMVLPRSRIIGSSAWRRCVGMPRSRPAQRCLVNCASASPATTVTLKQLCHRARRGQRTTVEMKEQLMDIAQHLASLQADQKMNGNQLNATWKLLWTTEKETLFILGLLDQIAKWQKREGHEVNVYQIIDIEAGYLQNVIAYDEDNAFVVNSDIEVQGEQRMGFEFVGAQLKLRGKVYNIPPFGKGWFDTVYMDADLRVAQDIRNDTLIVARDGPPKRFS